MRPLSFAPARCTMAAHNTSKCHKVARVASDGLTGLFYGRQLWQRCWCSFKLAARKRALADTQSGTMGGRSVHLYCVALALDAYSPLPIVDCAMFVRPPLVLDDDKN